MKQKLIPTLFLALASTGLAQTTLIGPGVRNGDFNDDTSVDDIRSSDDTPFWEGVAGVISIDQATRSNLPNASGTRNTQVSHQANLSLGQDTGHTIALNDSFSVSYEWRDAFNWDDATDKIRIVLFITDTDAIDGVRTNIGFTDSDLSTINNTYEFVDSDDFYVADASVVGKKLFVAIDTVNTDQNGFARLDDFTLSVGALGTDPLLLVEGGDYLFSDLIHPTGTASTTRTISFRNAGITNNLTLDSISLTGNSEGIFSITSAPTDGTVVAPGATFEIEVTATGGGQFNDYTGELVLATDPAGQGRTFPVSANISTGTELFMTGSKLLVDYDDGLDNGIHESSLRNGGFEDGANGQSLFDTPSWISSFSPEGDSVAGTLSTSPATGSFHGQSSGFVVTDPAAVPAEERTQPAVLLELAEWTLAAGDTFDIEFSAMGGTGFDGNNLQVIVEIIDEFGGLISDPLNDAGGLGRMAALPFNFGGDSSVYQVFSATTPALPRNSPWIGNRARIRILHGHSRTSFINIDNVSITGNFNTLVTAQGEPNITALDVSLDDQEVTIRFRNNGASSFSIESDLDLDFNSGSTLFPLDGSEDRSTYPGEIEFTFEDFNLVGPRHFWRVVPN
jgi:hypothetical protein